MFRAISVEREGLVRGFPPRSPMSGEAFRAARGPRDLCSPFPGSQTRTEPIWCPRYNGDQWLKTQTPRPQPWDPNVFAPRESWSLGDPPAQAELGAQVCRNTLGFCTRNLDRVFPEPSRRFSWKTPQGFVGVLAECWVLFPQTRVRPPGTGTWAGQRLLGHKEHPAGGLEPALGLLVHRPCGGTGGAEQAQPRQPGGTEEVEGRESGQSQEQCFPF